MAEQVLVAGLHSVPIVSTHLHKITDPVQNQYRRMTGQMPRDDSDIDDDRTPEEKGYVLRRRSEVRPNEKVLQTVRHRGEVKGRGPGRPGMNRRRSSMNDGDRRGYAGGYDSEGSVPPRSRNRARSQAAKSKRGSSKSSSEDLCSSTDEENQAKKMSRKKWLTAALASVATIHAASKVYSSIEAHDKRIIEVERGNISPEEAHKKQKAARWQDAAAIGIAALGVKGAISEWNEMKEEHEQHREFLKKKEEHHRQRLERARRDKSHNAGGYYKGRDGGWYYDGQSPQDSERGKVDGPRNGDRKLIGEGPRSRSRKDYGDDRKDYRNGSDARSRSRYDDRSRRNSRYAYDDSY